MELNVEGISKRIKETAAGIHFKVNRINELGVEIDELKASIHEDGGRMKQLKEILETMKQESEEGEHEVGSD